MIMKYVRQMIIKRWMTSEYASRNVQCPGRAHICKWCAVLLQSNLAGWCYNAASLDGYATSWWYNIFAVYKTHVLQGITTKNRLGETQPDESSISVMIIKY